ncbi:MAG: TMEM43 family protein [Bacteroidales bacterium]|nr:TMEM43 family protein [Bacteroidales bacterium]
MAYTETTRQSYGSRVGQSFKNIISGLVLFIGATCLLWWNEGRAVHTADMLQEAGSAVQPLDNVDQIDNSLNGMLVHATGMAMTTDSVRDGLFGIAENALALKREVQYYQWVEKSKSETKEKLGGAKETVTTYTYEQKWVSNLYYSHHNI